MNINRRTCNNIVIIAAVTTYSVSDSIEKSTSKGIVYETNTLSIILSMRFNFAGWYICSISYRTS